MTEEEAKMKTCCGPQILTLLLALNDARVVELVDNPGRCIGSSCMAWRTTSVGRVLPGDEYRTYRDESYCGLAGAPS